jgi:DNA polymerase-1
VGLLNPNDKSEQPWGEEKVRARTGVGPGQVVDWLSLIGDSVDNISGVPGVGPKTATDLLNQFGSIDGIYARLAEVKSERIRESLRVSEGIVRRNQELIRLHTEVPGTFDLDALAVREPDAGALLGLFRRWGFKSMAAQIEAVPAAQGDLL